jgi:hypothetical protein
LEDRTSGEVQHALLARVADEVAGVCCLASLGYDMQALVLAASAYEVGHLSAYIAFDDSLAREWSAWSNPTKTFGKRTVRELTRGGLRNAGMDPQTEDKQYYWYQVCCASKHANPVLQRKAGVSDSDAMRLLNANPEFSPGAGNRAFLAMLVAGVGAAVALRAFSAGVPNGASAEVARRAHDVVPRWHSLARAFGEYVERKRGSR